MNTTIRTVSHYGMLHFGDATGRICFRSCMPYYRIGQRIRCRAHHRQLEQSMSTIAFVIEEEMIRVVNLCHYESHLHG